MRYRARCSVCGTGFLSPPDREPPPCISCGAKTYVFIPKRHVRWASSVLLGAGALGHIYWIDRFLQGFLEGKINFVPNNELALTEFFFAMILLLCASASTLYAIQSFRGGRTHALLSGIFGIFAFGYGAGAALAVFGIILVAYFREEFYV